MIILLDSCLVLCLDWETIPRPTQKILFTCHAFVVFKAMIPNPAQSRCYFFICLFTKFSTGGRRFLTIQCKM